MQYVPSHYPFHLFLPNELLAFSTRRPLTLPNLGYVPPDQLTNPAAYAGRITSVIICLPFRYYYKYCTTVLRTRTVAGFRRERPYGGGG